MKPLLQYKPTILPLFIAGVLASFGFLRQMQAVVPAPDGCYPNFTTAEGCNALNSLTTGAGNTGLGWRSLFFNTDGSFNTGVGGGALIFNNGSANTAVGAAALLLNTTGAQNTAIGTTALLNNDDGAFNTATGNQALFNNTAGTGNTAIGSSALFDNTAGGFNTATGYLALVVNDSGDGNTAIGYAALNVSTGDRNTALGYGAGINVTTANNVICIGHGGQDVSNSCYIGQIYSNVQPQVGTDPDLVTINSDGRLGRANVSSRRYKHDIQPMHTASEAIYALQPVSFRYHKEYDATQTVAFGLIAEEVAELYPDLVGHNSEGQPESVRYEQINVMLLNEFLKEHRNNEEQQSKIDRQEAKIARQEKQIEALTVGLQRVSAQLELSGAAPQTVQN